MHFDYIVHHVPAKSLYTANTLSLAPLSHSECACHIADFIEEHVITVVSHLPASKDYLQLYKQTQGTDPVCSQLLQYCHNGWPLRCKVKGDLLHYWDSCSELTTCDGLLLYGSCIVVPKPLQQETLRKIHQGHRGIEYGGQEFPELCTNLCNNVLLVDTKLLYQKSH